MRIFHLIFIALLGLASGTVQGQESPAPVETGTTGAPSSASGDASNTAEMTAHELLASAMDLQNGVITSYTEASMVVHRPDWERTSHMVVWTRGREDVLIRFTAPAKDAGNATLKLAEKMWTFTSKLNRSIRLPYSLMSQSWGGSDFSYNDLSRTDILLREYDLSIVERNQVDGHTVYVIEAIPYENAPVVWGKEVLVIRDDFVLLKQTFYDQDFEPLKVMETTEIRELGGRVFGTKLRMVKLEAPESYTEFHMLTAEFDMELDDRLFTLFSLQSGTR